MKHQLTYTDYLKKIYAGWMGKSLGGTIGARMENHKTQLHLTKEELWPETIMPNDDMDIQIVWLEALQERGIWIESDDLAEFWQDRCWYNFCEYGVFLNNFQRGIHPPLSGTWNNRFFYESEGCPIRSEIWGLICPGNARLAAEYARKDAQLDHGGASEECEMFLAAAAAAAFLDDDVNRGFDAGLAVLQTGNQVRPMVNETRRICEHYPSFDTAWRLIVRRYGNRDASKAIMNQAIVVMSLLLGNGDFAETMRLACNSGWDTDCTAATAGALLGIMKGDTIFPDEWVDKMGKNLACGIKVNHQHASFAELTEDTAHIGVEMAALRNCEVDISGAPRVPVRLLQRDMKLTVSYPTGPCLQYKNNIPIRLQLSNNCEEVLSGEWQLQAPQGVVCSRTSGSATVAPGESVNVELTVRQDSGPVTDKNIFELRWKGNEPVTQKSHRFGLGGARLWRVYGPYWDMWDTSKSEENPYHLNGEFKFPANGDSWNHYVRLDREYLDEQRLLREDIPEELPELLQMGEDYLSGSDLAGFQGQACFYIVREIVASEERDVTFNITCNAPHAVWFDGTELTRREKGREVSPQDGGAGKVRVCPVPKRLVIKVARQIDPLSLCVTAVGGGGDPEKKRGISMFADFLADIPPATGMRVK
jgi:ADP-ribosylglycohydrolase